MSVKKPNTLPVIDLSLFSNDHIQRESELEKINKVSHETGFFYLINHGIDPTLIQQVQEVARRFFSLPLEEKLRVQMVHSPHFRGYNQPGSELTRNIADNREQFDIGAERQPLPVKPNAPAWQRLQGPNQWPASLPELQKLISLWQQEMTQIALTLLRALAESLRLSPTVFDVLYGAQPNEHIKLIRYPGQPADGSHQGVGSHKDSGFLSFLLQDDQPGLQVEVSEGKWIDALPLPGAFVVNIGELLELATNGYLRATVHRVISPPAGSERLSVAFFLGAELNAVIPVFKLPCDFAKQAHGPASDPHNPLLREVGFNYLKGRLRSHPDVAQRFYADVLS
ncbi:isopenicillin N synthase family dioxygenase [Pantoea ananatis]|uniref:isopenicillin N synthase family dioxygenase n=1 Tax=Pantoea ananas TaxID=553 RepID=UPI000D5F3FE2|nr:isopenicillin N synthase family oxygenase [Pantoea ananatis]PVY88375.1 isopenicillin N synthase-like dioxygenase [Pantoea ananatis]